MGRVGKRKACWGAFMQDITTANDTKKATKLGMKIFKGQSKTMF